MDYTATLKEFIRAAGITQAELADKAGITQVSISRYVNGRLPDIDAARALDTASDGNVPFALWQSEQAARLGLLPQVAA